MICITISMWTSRTEFIIGTKATWIFMIGIFRVLLLGVHDNFPTWILLTARLVLSILLYKFISNVIALICLHYLFDSTKACWLYRWRFLQNYLPQILHFWLHASTVAYIWRNPILLIAKKFFFSISLFILSINQPQNLLLHRPRFTFRLTSTDFHFIIWYVGFFFKKKKSVSLCWELYEMTYCHGR